MPLKTLIRADDYDVDRPIYTFTIVNPATLEATPLASCTVQSTWRVAPVAPGTDATNAAAPITASITFDAFGAVTESDGLALPTGGTASDGVLALVADRTVTAALPLAAVLMGDVQVTDANGKRRTVKIVETIAAEDGYTDDPAE